MSHYNYEFKLILIGRANVGKSCLLQRFIEETYTGTLTPTVGVAHGTKEVQVNGNKIKLNIWDTAGTESYRSVATSYFRG